MKLRTLRFKNINSLAGEWRIDFTAPAFETDGIFAITGPTGAGKSTLLDAVCLALYGRTPRLKVISKTTNELMSRQTAECFAEVEFETDQGRFRCHWGQWRAGKKSDGNLQDSKHELSDAVTGKVLESKKRQVEQRVIAITGLDFDRFTRSMMLAQGGFSAFLAASPDERSPILEQLTGTGIYSQISKQAHEAYRRADEQKKLIEASLGSIRILKPEEEAQIMVALTEKQQEKKRHQEKREILERSLQWYQTMTDLEAELAGLAQEYTAAAAEQEKFVPDQRRLELAEKAARLEPDFVRLEQARTTLYDLGKRLATRKQELPKVESALAAASVACDRSVQTAQQAEKNLKKERGVIQKVRALDQQAAQIKETVDSGRKEHRGLSGELSEKQRELDGLDTRCAALKKEADKLTAFLKDNQTDRELPQVISGLKEKITFFKALEDRLAVQTWKVKEKKETLKALRKQEKETAQRVADQTTARNREKKALEQLEAGFSALLDNKPLREWRKDYDHAVKEQVYQQKILSLADHRQQLKAGEACPLCGATEHPFAADLPFDSVDAVKEKIDCLGQRIDAAEKMEQQILERREKCVAIDLALAGLKKDLETLTQAGEQAHADCRIHQTECRQLEDEKKQGLARITAYAGPLPEDGTSPEPAGILAALEKRAAQYHRKMDREREVQQQLTEARMARQGLKAGMDGLSGRMKLLEKAEARQQEKLQAVQAQRADLYGAKDPDTEEQQLEKELAQKQERHETARRQKERLVVDLEKLRHEIASLTTSMEQQAKASDRLEQAFAAALEAEGFENELAFAAVRLPAEKVKQLRHKSEQIRGRLQEIQVRQKDRQERLEALQKQQKTDQDMVAVKAALETVTDAIRSLDEQTGALKQQLSENRTAKESFNARTRELEHATEQLDRMGRLHDLLGSADGKKYRNFAQGLTFEIMVGHANRSLAKMTDRYLLLRDSENPLELNVMDNYQAGEIRSVKNLSGGESFIVSLSLALGLSSMAGRNIRVDCLFLDEGFGTLDETALETALDVLAGLHREGKLIGVISHVAAIRERIPARIAIQPVSGGRSVISGPGCRRMSAAG